MAEHRSGFVNIVGRPNVGKSTLMNALVGERMSIITNKPQTTRHRIIGIVSDDDYQMVFSDTPGLIEDPSYKMQEAMNHFVVASFQDADLVLFVTTLEEKYEEDDRIIRFLKKTTVPKILIINKTDIMEDVEVVKMIQDWNKIIAFDETFPISALKKKNTDQLLACILGYLPEGPIYYPKDQLTDKPERFFASEIIREKILMLYKQEIPYSCEVIIEEFKEGKTNSGADIIRIGAVIFVNRKSQKMIIIGKGGGSIKKLGMLARKDIEAFTEKKVFLELFVKVKENWRDDDRYLKSFGYSS